MHDASVSVGQSELLLVSRILAALCVLRLSKAP
jgi:hypothetical protein